MIPQATGKLSGEEMEDMIVTVELSIKMWIPLVITLLSIVNNSLSRQKIP